MDEERLREAERERDYVLEAARWDSFICRGLVETTLPELVAEVRRLQGGQREALRVLGAIISQHVQGRVEVPEEALLREYTVSRTKDPASMTVRFRAEPADES